MGYDCLWRGFGFAREIGATPNLSLSFLRFSFSDPKSDGSRWSHYEQGSDGKSLNEYATPEHALKYSNFAEITSESYRQIPN